MPNLDSYREEFIRDGFTLVKGAIRPETALLWAERARDKVGNRVDRTHGEAKNLDEGGAYHYRAANAYETHEILPELFGWYETAPLWLQHIVQRDVICSPYPSSAITLKVYDRPGDEQGWHLDTNPLTVLLILTATQGDYGTEMETRSGTHFNLKNDPGDCFVFLGRELRHRVPPLPTNHWRVTIPLNYYHPDDTWRPEGMDDIVYGEV